MEPDWFEIIDLVKLTILAIVACSIFERNRYWGKCRKHLCDLQLLGGCETSIYYCPQCEGEKHGRPQEKT